jgi:hypothetical protein
VSVCIRPFEEKMSRSLGYIRRYDYTTEKTDSLKGGYFKLVHGHQYRIAITFNAGSTIAQNVAAHQYRPIIYLSVKSSGSNVPIGSRIFTNFLTNWGMTTESMPNESEISKGLEAIAEYLKEAERRQITQINLINSFGSGGYESDKHQKNTQSVKFIVDLQNAIAPMREAIAVSDKNNGTKNDNGKNDNKTNHNENNDNSFQDIDTLISTFQTKPLHSIQLRPFMTSESSYNPKVSVDSYVQSFIRNELGDAMASIEAAARTHALDEKSDASSSAKHILSTLSAVNQLTGWQHVTAYILHRSSYLDRLTSAATKNVTMHMSIGGGRSSDGKEIPQTFMDEFQVGVLTVCSIFI